MKLSRRGFISIAAASTSLSHASESHARSTNFNLYDWAPHPEDIVEGPVFRHGVASGDPLKRRVILWTRVTPRFKTKYIKVRVVVSKNPNMSDVVCKYTEFAHAYDDFTIKFDAYGLKAGTTYYYQFQALGEKSVIGRTRTLPRHTDRVRFAVASCSNYPAGFFGAYEKIAYQENIDAVIHLGDYIYEYANRTFGDGTDLDRLPSPDKEIVALSDYRERHAQYKTDPQLQHAHQMHPWIVVWDDHESTNDAYKDGAQNHQPETEGDWGVRKVLSRKAYFEWMPIRDNQYRRLYSGKIFRRFKFGDLVQLDMLDTRLFGREQQVTPIVDPFTQELLVDPTTLPELLAELNRPDRQLLGSRQEKWLYNQIEHAANRGIKWQVFGQQVMMGQLQSPLPSPPFQAGTLVPLNPDQWDGYVGARNRFLEFLSSANPTNNVVLTGDIHSSWFHDVAMNPYDGSYNPANGAGADAVEFVTPAISSPFFTDPNTPAQVIQGLEQQILAANPHTHYIDFERRGYMVIDIDWYRTKGEWYHVDTVTSPTTTEFLAATVEVQSGTNHGEVTQQA